MELDESRTKFSMSQPELDTGYKFDIPSPPPVATDRPESPFTFLRQAQPSAPVNTRPDPSEPLANSSTRFVVHEEPKAPIASVPELQLDEDELKVDDEAAARDAASSETARDVAQTGLLSGFGSVCTTDDDDNIIQETYTITETLQTVTLSHHPAEAPDAAGDISQSGETFLPSGESKLYTTITDSPPVVHEDKSALLALSRVPEPASVASAVSRVKSQPVHQDAIYGVLSDSLFPQGFISKGDSALSHSDVRPQMQHRIKPEPVVIKTFYECDTETNAPVSRLAAESSDGASLSSVRKASGIQCRFLPSQAVCPDLHYSELSRPHSEAKSDSFSLIQETVTSVPLQNSAPPVSHNVTSQGAVAQVTDAKRRVILVKELVTDEASADPECPSAAQDKMSTVKGLEIKMEPPRGHVDDGSYEAMLSPGYLSVGSDDGSAMEIYYSAEEDNPEESRDEDMYTMDERKDNSLVDGTEVHQKQGEMERLTHKREGGIRAIIVKMQNEESKTEDFSCQTDVQQQRGGRSGEAEVQSEFPVIKDGPSQQKAAAAAPSTALPQTSRGGEARKEELLATPVEQVNTPMVCKVEPRGQGEGLEGNPSQNVETEAHLNGKTDVPGQETQCASHKDLSGPDCADAASSDSRGENVNTPTLRRAEEEQVSEAAHRSREASQEGTETIYSDTNAASLTAPGAEVTSGTELQSDAAEPPRPSEWADTITQSVNGNGAVHEQVAVEPSDADVRRSASDAAQVVAERHTHPAEAQPDLDQG